MNTSSETLNCDADLTSFGPLLMNRPGKMHCSKMALLGTLQGRARSAGFFGMSLESVDSHQIELDDASARISVLRG
jgi:hypothetical protein